MLIDSHCHIPHRKYTKTPDQVIADAVLAGVEKLINIGTSIKENSATLGISNRFPNVYSAIGIYPHEERGADFVELMKILEEQIDSSTKVVAVGECGIDITNWENARPISEQIALFEAQIRLALKKDLPIVIHNNNGDEQVFRLLTEYVPQGLRGVAHCFTSENWEVAKKFLDFGFYLSFAGKITYNARKSLLDIVAKVPDDRILVETDAPYLPPEGFRGTVNEPARVTVLAQKVATARNVPFAKIEEITYSNTCRLFKI